MDEVVDGELGNLCLALVPYKTLERRMKRQIT